MFTKLYKRFRNKIYRWLTYEPPSDAALPYDFNRLKHEIRPGDVLLIEGRNRLSQVIRTITQSPWTHAALYIGRPIDFEDESTLKTIAEFIEVKNTTHLIIEDLIDRGTIINPLSFYIDHHIRICRPIGVTPADLELVIKYALKALGQPYNVRHLIDIGRFMLPWSILPRRWGSSLFRTSTGEPESAICSSLIAEAFSSVQFPILPLVTSGHEKGTEVFQRNPHLFTPKDFDYSPYFAIIKYPLFNPDEPLPYYRRMPWARSGLLYQDQGILSAPQTKTTSKKRLRIFKSKTTDQDTDKNDEDKT